MRRYNTPSVVYSKKFLATAAVSAVVAGTALGIVTGIIPAEILTSAWSAHEDRSTTATSLPSKTDIAGRRYEGTRREADPRTNASTGRKPGMFKRLFGRLAALFTKDKDQVARSARGENPRPEYGAAGRDGRGAPSGGDIRRYDSAASLSGAVQPVDLDADRFGVGLIGLGLGGDGGPIAAGAAGAAPQEINRAGAREYDPYFDAQEAVPQVKPAASSELQARSISAGGADEGSLEEGAPGTLNGETAGRETAGRHPPGRRTQAGGARETAPAAQDAAADYSRQKTADDQWADKKGGADLKKHKIQLPEIGGGKGIRNAPSRSR